MNGRPRLLIFEPYCDGIYGNQRYLKMLGAGLANDGFDVHIAVPETGALTEWLNGEPMTVHVLESGARSSHSRSGKFVSSALAVFSLHRLMRRTKPDTVHANNLRSLLTIGPAARVQGVPLLWYVKGLDNVRVARFGSHLATRRIAMGRALLERLDGHSKNIDEARDLLPLGAPSIGGLRGRSVVRAELDISPERPVMLLASSVVPNKGVHFAIEAISRLTGRAGDALLLVAGEARRDGGERYAGMLKSLIDSHGLTDRVRFLGYRDDVPDLMSASDLFLLPSIMEAVGRTIVEAMQCGVPVIASHTGAVPETVIHGETGYLVPVGDVGAIARSMQELLEDAALRKSFGAAALVRAQRYSIEHNVATVAGIHRGFIEGQKR